MRSLIFLLLLSFNATAALYDRGNGLIYDDVLDITWLQDANYAKDNNMDWYQAINWADELLYAGFSDWRLPKSGTDLSHKNSNGNGELEILNDQIGTVNFYNVGNIYWYAEEVSYSTSNAWTHYISSSDWNSVLMSNSKTNGFYAWAVHDGDIGASPVPLPAGIYLFLSGLVGLVVTRFSRRGA